MKVIREGKSINVKAQQKYAGLKVVFFSSYPGFSGSHKMALQLAQAFASRGGTALAAAPADMEFLAYARKAGIQTIILKAPPTLLQYGGVLATQHWGKQAVIGCRWLLPYSIRLSHFFRKNRVDLLYASTERCVLLAGPGAYIARVPVIWHAQGGLTVGSKFLHWAAARLASRIVCVSQSVAKDLQTILGTRIANKSRIVYNGIPDIPHSKATMVSENNETDKLRVVFLGNIAPHKGVHHLIRAFLTLPENWLQKLELWLVGPYVDSEYFSYLKGLLADTKWACKIRFWGYHEDVNVFLQQATLVVCPSVEYEELDLPGGTRQVICKEGFGLVALEAMRAGKPVVASRTYGLAEVVRDGETGLLVPPGDVEALRTAILYLLEHPEERLNMGVHGRKRFLEEFSFHRMTEAFFEVLEELIRR